MDKLTLSDFIFLQVVQFKSFVQENGFWKILLGKAFRIDKLMVGVWNKSCVRSLWFHSVGDLFQKKNWLKLKE